MKKIAWVYEGEAGFWTSLEDRFSISPIYIGRTTPQGYELRDVIGTQRVKGGFYSVREAKDHAQKIIENRSTL